MGERIKKINKDITNALYSLSNNFIVLSDYFKKLAQLSEQSMKKPINKNSIIKEKIKSEKEEINENNKYLSKKRNYSDDENKTIKDLETNIEKDENNEDAYKIKFKIRKHVLILGPYNNLAFCHNVKDTFKESINGILSPRHESKQDIDNLFKGFKNQLYKEFPPIS